MLFLKYKEARRRTSSRQPESLAAMISCISRFPQSNDRFKKYRHPKVAIQGGLKLREDRSKIQGGSRTELGRIPPACGCTRQCSRHWRGTSTQCGGRRPRATFPRQKPSDPCTEPGNGNQLRLISVEIGGCRWKRSGQPIREKDAEGFSPERGEQRRRTEKGSDEGRRGTSFFLISLFNHHCEI